MSITTSLAVAFSLSMDAFAASLGKGAVLRRPSVLDAVRIGAWFGTFELAAPVIGLAIGLTFAGLIEAFDHWVAFIILGLVGGRMIWLALRDGDDVEADDKPTSHSAMTLALTAVATSIDATAVGVTLNYMNVDLVLTIALIGLVTFSMTFCGVLIGRVVGPMLGRWSEIIGGLALIAIGTKILIEHTMGG